MLFASNKQSLGLTAGLWYTGTSVYHTKMGGSMSVDGKVTIISGANGSLGQVVTRTFYGIGATVILVGTRQESLQTLADELGTDRTLPIAANLIEPAGAERVVAQTVEKFGRVDILLNLAGGFAGGEPVSDSEPGTLQKMLNLNLHTTYNLSQAAVKPMIEQGWGRIINIGSRDAVQGRANYSAYAISKAGVLRLTEAMAAELPPGLTVNAILPGIIDTDANRQSMPNADHTTWVKPATIAETMLFLVQEKSAINGAAIPMYKQAQ